MPPIGLTCATLHPKIVDAHATLGTCTTVIARVPKLFVATKWTHATMKTHVTRHTMLQCRHLTRYGGSRKLRIPITHATVIACVPMRSLLQCHLATRDGGSRHVEILITLAPSRTHPEAYVATVSVRSTVIPRVPKRTLLECDHVARDGRYEHLKIPITLAPHYTRATVITRVRRRSLLQCCHITRACRSRHMFPNTLARIQRRTRYIEHTRLEAYLAIVS